MMASSLRTYRYKRVYERGVSSLPSSFLSFSIAQIYLQQAPRTWALFDISEDLNYVDVVCLLNYTRADMHAKLDDLRGKAMEMGKN